MSLFKPFGATSINSIWKAAFRELKRDPLKASLSVQEFPPKMVYETLFLTNLADGNSMNVASPATFNQVVPVGETWFLFEL